MILDETPTELKELIFTHFTPEDWINTAKVSNEWLELTLGSIKKVESCHILILDHLAAFINQVRNTNYTWVSLLTLMPRLEHLECNENTDAFWKEISPVCHQLKILHFKPINDASFDWNTLDITFDNLSELLWDGNYEGMSRILELAPKLEKLTLLNVEINAEWKNKIPKSVKHILLKKAIISDDNLLIDLSENTSALETFSAERCSLSSDGHLKFFDKTSHLKILQLDLNKSDASTSIIVERALRKCRGLEIVKAHGVNITECWRRVMPKNVKSIDFFKVNVHKNIRSDFSLDWLFQNYGSLQSLELRCVDWTGFESQKFYSTEKLKKLALDNYMSLLVPGSGEGIDPFSDICLRMIRGSHLVDVEICKLTIDEYWKNILPPTIRKLKIKDFRLSEKASEVFSPQFICENPSNIESLIFDTFHDDLPAMDLNAFTGMHMLRELHLNDLRLTGECLQSILTHCSALTDLYIRGMTAGALTYIPQHLVLPSLRRLYVKESIDQPLLLLQRYPSVRVVDIAIVPSVELFSAIPNALPSSDTVELKIRHLSCDLLRYLVKSIDDTRYKYFCLSVVDILCEEVSFYWTNSLLNACHKLNDIIILGVNSNVLWINNFPTSTFLRKIALKIPSSMHELSQRYQELMAPKVVEWNNDIAHDEDEMMLMFMNRSNWL